MPLDLAAITSGSATARVDYGAAGDITIVFRPENITETTIAQWQAIAAREDDDMLAVGAALNALLCQLIISHDLTRRGVPIPPTEEGYASVPLQVRADMMNAILEEISLDPKGLMPSPPPSPATFAPAGRGTSPKRASKRSRPH